MATREEIKFLDAVGHKIRDVRKAKGITQESLSDLSGIETVSIGYIEQGKRRPTLTTLYRLSNALGVKLKDLLPD